ncbi:hypothetical protein DIPPA_14329 [Diplonema papillatum]|nr:hypothetical protein DIPPA_14329 [Diplonema papillatum]
MPDAEKKGRWVVDNGGAEATMEQAIDAALDQPGRLACRHSETHEVLAVEVPKFSLETVYLAQLRQGSRGERSLRSTIGRLAEILQQHALEGGRFTVMYESEGYLVDRKGYPLAGAHNLLLCAGAVVHANGYDLVISDAVDSKTVEARTSVMQCMQRELGRLRWDTSIVARDPSEVKALAGSWFNCFTVCHSRLVDYAEEIEEWLSSESLAESECGRDDGNAARAWSWCLHAWAFAAMGDLNSIRDVGYRRSAEEKATRRLDLATQALLECVVKKAKENGHEQAKLAESAAQKGMCVVLDKCKHLPTEGRSPCSWRLNEVFEQIDPCKKTSDPSLPADPPALLNPDSSCWLNAALLVLHAVPRFRALLYSFYEALMTSDKVNLPNPKPESDDPKDTARFEAAREFVESVAVLFAFLSPSPSRQKYLFNTPVKLAYESYSRSLTGQACTTVTGDTAEFFGNLPELLATVLSRFGEGCLGKELADCFDATTTVYKIASREEKGSNGGWEAQAGEEQKEYPFFITVAESTTVGAGWQKGDLGSSREVREVNSPALTPLARAEASLPYHLLKALSTQGHSVRAVHKVPDVLTVVIRRQMWSKAHGTTYLSKAQMPVPLDMSVEMLLANERVLQLRVRLMALEQKIQELTDYQPTKLVMATSICASPVPGELLESFTCEKFEKLTAAATTLTAYVAELEAKRKSMLDGFTRERDEVLEALLGDRPTDDASSSATTDHEYVLTGAVSYSENRRGHYWSYIRDPSVAVEEEVWLKYDDTPLTYYGYSFQRISCDDALPNYERISSETMVREVSVEGSCLIYARRSAERCEPKLLDSLHAVVAANNERMRQLNSLYAPDECSRSATVNDAASDSTPASGLPRNGYSDPQSSDAVEAYESRSFDCEYTEYYPQPGSSLNTATL